MFSYRIPIYPLFIPTVPALILITAGIILGRKTKKASQLARWITPAAFLAALLCMVFWYQAVVPESVRSPAPVLVLAALLAAPACLCAFLPKRPCYLLACAAGLFGFFIILMGFYTCFFLWPRNLEAGICAFFCMLALMFSFMGLVLPRGRRPQAAEGPKADTRSGGFAPQGRQYGAPQSRQSPQEPFPTPQSWQDARDMTARGGFVTVLRGEMAGMRIALKEGEAFEVGRDPSRCHLLLPFPQCPEMLCTILWLPATGTYLVTCRADNCLFIPPEAPMPADSICELFPGDVLSLREAGAIIRLGA